MSIEIENKLKQFEVDALSAQCCDWLGTDELGQLVACTRALAAMTERFYCPGDSVYESAISELAKLEAMED